MTIQLKINIRFVERMTHHRIRNLITAFMAGSYLVGDWVIISIREIPEADIRVER